ncbi:hypothetical protein ACHAXR_012355 [Thalassiosira sp. AJA248-18]
MENTPPYSHPSLKGIKYVLFPHDTYVQHWDNFFLCILLYYCFSIPYTVGISGGYRMYHNTGWFAVNVGTNCPPTVDTFMQFFRAYYTEDGLLVYELRRIAKNYLFSRNFVLNLIASFPMQTADDPFGTRGIHLLATTQLFKLLRIARINSLTKTSIAIQSWWERQDVARAMLASFILKLVVVSHWIACFWSFIAFVQVGTFGSDLGQKANWISNWYESSYIEGGINPIGWESDIDRYALSLFWSIQSLTSIGYGNIVPVTRTEYYVTLILMLCSGLFWTFVIGNIVSIAEHMKSVKLQYKRRLDDANTFIGYFSPSVGKPNEQADIGVGDADAVATRVRRFVTAQYDRTMLNRTENFNSPTLNQVFPALDSLSLELRRLSSLHLMRKYIEMVPYLSHKYLTPEEQSDLAFKCVHLEFSRGESFIKHPQYGRGIMILRKGFCLAIGTIGSCGINAPVQFEFYNRDNPIAVDDVLVEDTFLIEHQSMYRFVSYSLVVFIPRSVIYEVLNAKAWKDCGRWKYLRACLLKWSREKKNVDFNGKQC